ncbi:MAG: MerR family DNA-binding transcriptional regulator [Parcubacteria group bacterium]|jgi:excisionase family DNA binding protein
MEQKPLISIGEAAKKMHISIDTLRRWDNEGRFPAVRLSGKRFYRASDIEKYLAKLTIAEVDIFEAAKKWASNNSATEPDQLFYCKDSSVFQYRLHKLENALSGIAKIRDSFPLLTSITGEIGNNSFDHNIGQWPDIPGIFFGYDIERREIVLADRGQGILATLKRVKKELSSDAEALRVAFTEIISGRSPEARGNGLKYVKEVVMENDIYLFFQTGNAGLELEKGDQALNIIKVDNHIRGCIALIKF